MAPSTLSDLPPLVLLPGLLCNRNLWAHQLDHLGHVADLTVADLTRHDSVEEMAESVLAKSPDRFTLAGLSMGGYVALEIMRRAPERVARLALLNTSARPDAAEQSARREDLIRLSELGTFKGVTPRLLPLLLHEEALDNTLIVGAVMAMAEDVGQEGFARQQRAILTRPDSRPGLSSIACPTLVIGGDADQLTPPARSRDRGDGGLVAPLRTQEAEQAVVEIDFVRREQTVHRLPEQSPEFPRRNIGQQGVAGVLGNDRPAIAKCHLDAHRLSTGRCRRHAVGHPANILPCQIRGCRVEDKNEAQRVRQVRV